MEPSEIIFEMHSFVLLQLTFDEMFSRRSMNLEEIKNKLTELANCKKYLEFFLNRP